MQGIKIIIKKAVLSMSDQRNKVADVAQVENNKQFFAHLSILEQVGQMPKRHLNEADMQHLS